jgi:hypothetical protein
MADSERGEAVGTVGKQAGCRRQQERRGVFGRRMEINRLAVHGNSKKQGMRRIFSAEPPKRKVKLNRSGQ